MTVSAAESVDPVRVLIVDDQELIRGGLAAILRGSDGIDVVGEAADGRRAVDQAVSLLPDVVLMDVEMPGGDGISATRELLARCRSTKVVMLTTFDLDEYVYEALRAGASGFLLKTTSPARLIDAVRACAGGEALLAPSVTRRLIETYVDRAPGASRQHVAPGLATLTPRELEVLTELASGKSNSEIGAALFLGEATVKTHVTHILAKLNMRDRVQAVVVRTRAD